MHQLKKKNVQRKCQRSTKRTDNHPKGKSYPRSAGQIAHQIQINEDANCRKPWNKRNLLGRGKPLKIKIRSYCYNSRGGCKE